MEYFSPRKIIILGKEIVVLFDRTLAVDDIRQKGVSVTSFEGAPFVLIGSELIAPAEVLRGFEDGVDLLVAGGDPGLVMPTAIERLHLDARAITKMEVWIEMQTAN